MTVQWATCAAGVVLGRAQHAGAVAHPLRRLDEHPAELAAADHAQRRRGKQSVAVLSVRDDRDAGSSCGDSPTASV